MLWAPNSRFGEVGDTRGGYSQYWPGVEHVDMVGKHATRLCSTCLEHLIWKPITLLIFDRYLVLSLRRSVWIRARRVACQVFVLLVIDKMTYTLETITGYERLNVLPEPHRALDIIKQFSDVCFIHEISWWRDVLNQDSWPLEPIHPPSTLFKKPSCWFDRFLQLYALPNNLPMVLSETGASYTRSLETGQPAPGGASEYDMKLEWLKKILSHDIVAAAPGFKAFLWVSLNPACFSSFTWCPLQWKLIWTNHQSHLSIVWGQERWECGVSTNMFCSVVAQYTQHWYCLKYVLL